MRLRYLGMIPALALLAACVPEGASPVAQAPRPPAVEPVTCTEIIGPLAVREPANLQLMGMLTTIGVDSPANALRIIAQRSGCFDVMDYQTLEQRLTAARATPGRAPAASPVLGGVVYVLQPSLSINLSAVTTPQNAPDRANVAPVAGQRTQDVLGMIAPGVRNAAASISLMAVEMESGRQVAVAQGDHTNADIDIAAPLLGPQARGLGTGYTQTAEGRTILVALQKAFNGLVEDMRARDVRAARLPAAAPAAAQTPPARNAPTFRPNAEFVVDTGTLNLRVAPIDGDVKRRLVGGTRVKTTEQRPRNLWWEIEIDGDTGWVSSQFLRAP